MSRQRLDQRIVELGLAPSRTQARAAIESGGVEVDGSPALRASQPVDPGASVTVRAPHPWVGRGGLKLDHALDLWRVPVCGRVVLDVGASTGGFTQVCLARGARRVFAVDVGRGQLHRSLRTDPRVTDLAAVDARALTRDLIGEAPDLVVCDASFIGLAKVLPVPLALAAPRADLVALVKPQFEVGPGRVGKGGVVADPAARQDALSGVRAFLDRAEWRVEGVAESPITGGDGNIEFLIWARRGEAAVRA